MTATSVDPASVYPEKGKGRAQYRINGCASTPRNDTATTSLPPGMELAVTVDTLVSGIHFPSDTAPVDIGYKALAVNISDLAAMGARPDWAVMSLTLPRWDEGWMSEFQEGFHALAEQHGVRLMAWDVGIGPLAITIQIHGQVPCGQALRRDGAHPGDLIFVTGTLGDAGLALAGRGLGTQGPEDGTPFRIPAEYLAFIQGRLARPTPRVTEGIALRGIAAAAIDISDGLAADLGHIVRASSGRRGERLSAAIHVEKLPLSPALRQIPDRMQAWRLALSSGDDYELCFTLSPDRHRRLLQVARKFSCPITCLGRMETRPDAPSGVRFLGRGLASGEELVSGGQGYRHF
uniref:Thiamine-monophosphate kinase n=1 Tax=Candidatus Kentrum sp. FM TaxID=2126340 RepID=A0A450TY03_9GAMM|nr:MAG: thiamine-monophosphate kinase [Candidatus Kentron sp. FM]VFJ74228.1 MAG: thiamine-monophosphate kinase [Candidatus Kentron sp. FM]VFK23274.1 MAG: thiamine-monophosphate kinase [Candidatus Kentron sp. FM]